jgi:Aminoglycoside-2''-adenylyltransferase
LRLESLNDVAHVVQPLMAGFPMPWCVAGGWALDLFLGRMTRSHADLELAIFRQDQAQLHRHFHAWTFEKIVNGQRQAWSEAERLELPVHEIHARSNDGEPCAIEFLLNERDTDNWIFRRSPSITLALDRAISRSATGLPVLSPEIVLLFKAKLPRPKDDCDFQSSRMAMSRPQRQWLRDSIAACHPGHAWLELFETAASGDA